MSAAIQRWTEREDALLAQWERQKVSPGLMASLLGREESAIYQRRVKLGLVKHRSVRARWTEDQDNYLREHIDKGWTYRDIARGLSRTRRRSRPTAIDVRNRAYRLGLGVWNDGDYSPSQLAAYLDISHSTVGWWVSAGALPATNVGRLRRVAWSDFVAFLENPRHWAKYDPERIQDADLRTRLVNLRSQHRFYTLKEVGNVLGFSASHVLTMVHTKGLKATRDHGLRFVVRNDWLDDFRGRLALPAPKEVRG